MQTAKNNWAESSSGRFQKTRAPMAKIGAPGETTRMNGNKSKKEDIGPLTRAD